MFLQLSHTLVESLLTDRFESDTDIHLDTYFPHPPPHPPPPPPPQETLHTTTKPSTSVTPVNKTPSMPEAAVCSDDEENGTDLVSVSYKEHVLLQFQYLVDYIIHHTDIMNHPSRALQLFCVSWKNDSSPTRSNPKHLLCSSRPGSESESESGSGSVFTALPLWLPEKQSVEGTSTIVGAQQKDSMLRARPDTHTDTVGALHVVTPLLAAAVTR